MLPSEPLSATLSAPSRARHNRGPHGSCSTFGTTPRHTQGKSSQKPCKYHSTSSCMGSSCTRTSACPPLPRRGKQGGAEIN
jgi:hypothetical protein